MTQPYIIATLRKEEPPYGACPVVLESNHPRFTIGTRFDYGFLQIALDEGYTVLFIGNIIPERANRWHNGQPVQP